MEIEASKVDSTKTTQDLAKGQQQSVRKYLNAKFPCSNVDLFDYEKEVLTKQLEEVIEQIYKNRDIRVLVSNLAKKRSKLQLLYGISNPVKSKMSEMLLHLAIEEQYMKIDTRLLSFPLNTKSVINWKPLWELVLASFQNELSNTNVNESTISELTRYLSELKALKMYYEDSSIAEVYDLYKKLKLSGCCNLSLILIRYFLKISRKTPKEYYMEIFNELTVQLNYDLTYRHKLTIITIISGLASAHPELEWENQYDQIFTYFSRFYLQRVPLGFSFSQPQQKNQYLSLYNPHFIIQRLLVSFIVPSTEKAKHNKIWENIHRFFNLFKQYLHPNYEGSQTIKFLLQQFQCFVSKYIQTHASQQKIIKSLEKTKQKLLFIQRTLNGIISPEDGAQNQDNITCESGTKFDSVKDQNVDTELLSEEDSNTQIDKVIDSHKNQQPEDPSGGGHGGQNSQSKTEDQEESDDESDDDDEEEDEILDAQQKEEFAQKTPQEQAQRIQLVKDRIEQISAKLELQKRFAFDKECNEQFEKVVEEVLVNVMFLNDSQNLLTHLCKDLCYFSPDKFIPLILHNILEAFDKPDMNFSTTIGILTSIIIPMVDRNHYKKGLYQVPSLMRKVVQIFNTSNFQLSHKMWKFFDQIFQVVPIYCIDDLLETYLANNPTKNSSDFYEDLNKGEEIDMRNFYEELSTATISAFQKFLSIFEHIDMPRSKNTRGFRAAVISVYNLFTSIAFSSSKSIFAQLWNHAFSCISDHQQNQASKFYSYLVHAFTLRDPSLTLSRMIPFLSSQILTPRSPSEIEELKKQPLYFLIENQENKEEILKHKIETINTASLFWYLNLLEDTIFFGREQILLYKNEIETIIFLCFVHEETELCKKACQLLQRLIHSLITFYPSEMFIWSENEIEDDPNFKEMYHKYIGQNSNKKFSMKWHEPTLEETQYAKSFFFKIYNPILAHYSKTYFVDLPEQDFSSAYSATLDHAFYAQDTAQRAVKIEHQRSIMVLFHLYSSIATRLKWGIDEKEEIYYKFCESFCLPEYNTVNKDMIEFCLNVLKLLIKQNLLYDSNISQVYLSLILFILGNDDQTGYINGIKNKLKDIKNFNSNPYNSYQGFPRFVEVTSVTTQFNTKVLLYTFDVKLNELHSSLFFPLLFLVMHPNQKVSEKSKTSFTVLADMLQTQDPYNKIIETYCSFLKEKLGKSSSQFLPTLIEASKEKDPKLVPILSTYLERVIGSISILNYGINKFSAGNEIILDTLLTVIESYNLFNQKDKDKIIESPLASLLPLIARLKKHEIAYSTPTPSLGIYKEKSKTLQDLLSLEDDAKRTFQLEGKEYQNLVSNILSSVYNRCIENLENPSVFSKVKVFMILIAMKIIDYTNIQDARFLKIFEQALIFCNQDNLHSRNIGRAVTFKCLRAIKAHYKTRVNKIITDDEYLLKQNKPLEDLLKYYLYRPEDIEEGYTSNRIQDYVLYKKSSTYNQDKTDNLIQSKMKDETYLTSFVEHFLNDITANSLAEQSLRPKNIFNNSDLIVSAEFIKNFKKKNIVYDNQQAFQIRFIKKIFSFTGIKFFDQCKIHLEKHKNNESTPEGSIIVNTLTFGLLLGVFSDEIDLTPEQKDETFNYLMSILNDRIYELNREQFAYFISKFEFVAEALSYKDAQKVFNGIYSYPKINNQEDQKYYRLLYCKVLSLSKYNIDNQLILSQLLTELKKVNPLSIQQLPIYNLVHNAIWSYYQIPFDLNLSKKLEILNNPDQLIESGQLKQMNSFQVIRSNQEIKEIYDFIASHLNSEDAEVRKKYYRITKLFSSVFKEDHLFKSQIFDSMRDLYPFLLQFKEEDISDQQLILELWTNLVSLSIPLYNKNTIIEILELCYSNFKNTNWRVRQRALLFSQYIAFFNLYRINDFNYIDPILVMMNDDQKQNKSIAQKVLSSMVKTLPRQEVGGFVERMQKMAVSEDKDQKIVGVYCLMSVLLSYPLDIQEWTENAIRTILKNKKITTDTLSLLKEFGATFLRNTYHNKMESKLKIPEDLIMRLEEISRPHNYFA